MATTTKTFVTTSTWLCPPGVTSIQVAAQGAGGGGGARTSNGGGGGGGGGEYAAESAVTVTPGTTYTITVGAAGTNNGVTVVQGGNSQFIGDNVTVLAHGGTTVGINVLTGGAGGTGSSNTTHHNGGAGFTSAGTTGGGGGSAASATTVGVTATSATGAASPSGAASNFGGAGGAGATVGNNNGSAPTNPAGGGGGGADRSSNGTRTGGNGQPGQIILTYTTPLAQSLTDTFAAGSVDTTKWSAFGTTAQSGGQLTLTSASGAGNYSGYTSLEIYDLTGSYVSSQLANAGDQTIVSWQAIPCLVQLDANNTLVWYVLGNLLHAQKQVATVFTDIRNDTAYDSTVHKYFRIRESGGTIFFDYSTDSQSWTNYTSVANPFAITAITIEIEGGHFSTETNGTSDIIDNFNIFPVPPIPNKIFQSNQAVNRASTY